MQRMAVGLILIAIASVQLGAAFAKGVFSTADPVTLAFLRAAIAACILVAITRPAVRGHSWRDWGLVAAYGLCLSGMNLCIYLSFARIPIGVAVTLEFVGPLGLALLGSRRLLDLVWVALAATGVVLLGAGPMGVDLAGAALALLAGLLWAGYIALAGPVARRWPSTSGLALGSLIGAMALLIPGVACADGAFARPMVWITMALVALLSTVIPYALELHARRSVSAAIFGILMSLEPAAAAVFAWMVLGERLGWVQWLAMACVVAASAGAVYAAAPVVARDARGHN